LETTSADEASAHGRPTSLRNRASVDRFKSGAQEVGFDAYVEREMERRRTTRSLDVEEITNRGIEVTFREMEEKKMKELKMKMKELTRTGKKAGEAQQQGVRWSDSERHKASSSDQEDRGVKQGEYGAGRKERKVSR